ncbi:MAG: sugar phosphate isomerase/epimerase [Ruminococcaceae bacterium]|nr:sugar phosphate isomerase/epimerase [Oscillospiraceae bacterium]
MRIPIAIQLYSVRDDMKTDLFGTLEKVKALGYDGVEFAGLFGEDPLKIKAKCEELGLAVLSAHVPYKDLVADPDSVLATYAALGVKYVTIPYLSETDRPGGDGFADVLKNLAMLGAKVNALGMTMLYHNHDFEFLKIDGKYALDTLYETIPADLLKTELDMCWVNVGGENPAEYLRKYTGRAPVVHYKDFYGEKSEDMYELIGINQEKPVRPGNFEFRPVGYGLQDFPAILEATRDAGAEWVVVEMDKPSMGLSPMECMEKSINYLKSIGC